MTAQAPDLHSVKAYLLALQNSICAQISELDGGQFESDVWSHSSGGGGDTRLITGDVIEKGGVNFSHVKGPAVPAAASAKRPDIAGLPFEAMGVSVVMHPKNPKIPTSHMNVRFFIVNPKSDSPIWWFGGGFDLTPYYGFEADCIAWHQSAQSALQPFGAQYYPKFKQWCDDYFYIKHRQEARGIGGLFFDDFNELGFEQSFALMRSVGDSYIKAYSQIAKKRKGESYSAEQVDFQQVRRGRYVEFNLVYDRGTLFGLQSNGRTESILMSLPPQVQWHYKYPVQEGSEEARLFSEFLPVRDWL